MYRARLLLLAAVCLLALRFSLCDETSAVALLSTDPESSGTLISYTKEARSLYAYGVGLLHNGSFSDPSEVLSLLEHSAQEGHDHALFLLGEIHEIGLGVPVNLTAAMQYYNASAAMGNDHAQVALGFLHETGTGTEANEAQALLDYHFAAMAGNTDAQMSLGFRYMYGYSVPRNCFTAAEYYLPVAQSVADDRYRGGVYHVPRQRLSELRGASDQSTVLQYFEEVADAGDAHAQTVLGQLHLVGQQGVVRDHDRAVMLLRQADAQGDTDARAHLAYMYSHGLGVERDTDRALRLYTDAANRGSPAAMTGLGQLYLLGPGVEQQPDKAFKYLNAAARAGHPHAQFYLGLMYIDGLGIKRDPALALQLFSQAAQQGHSGAMYRLALMHLSGIGTLPNCPYALPLLKQVAERGVVADRLDRAWHLYRAGQHTHALWLWERLAAIGSEEAQSNAAFMLQRGLGHAADPARALRLLSHAAEQGSVNALVEVGDAHYYGRGVLADSAAAVAWYGRAAEQRHAQAMFNLGWAHHAGDGAARDPHRAKHYYDRATELSREAAVPSAIALAALRLAAVLPPSLDPLLVLAWLRHRGDVVAMAVTAVVLAVSVLWRLRTTRQAAATAPPPQQDEGEDAAADVAADAQ